jgi:Carboxypeptidase regulatory-like domain
VKPYIVYLSILTVLILPSKITAQSLTGSIIGQVFDVQGAVLQGTEVTISSDALIGTSLSSRTNASGIYTFNELPPGVYKLNFKIEGFKVLSRSGIEINAGFTATINAALEAGTLEETVIINGESPVVDIKNNIQQTVLTNKQFENLPNGRDPWSIGRVVPGMQVSKIDIGGSNGMQQSNFTIHGSMAGQSQYSIDGLIINWPGFNEGGTTSVYFDQGMFQEIDFQTSALPAEFSVGGTVINSVTKTGSNDFHGNILFYYANSRFQGDNFQSNPRFNVFRNINPNLTTANRLNSSYDFNANIGGPIVKNRIWFFTSFRKWGVNKFVLGTPNQDGSPAIDDNQIDSLSSKVTWKINQSNTINFLYSRSQKNRFHRRDTPPFFIEDKAAWLQDTPGNVAQVTWTSMLSPKSVFEVKAGLVQIIFPLRYQKEVKPTDLSRNDSINSTRTGAAPYSFEDPSYRAEIDATISLMRSWNGLHSLKVGGQFSRQSLLYRYRVNGDLNLNYENGVPRSVTIYNTPIDQYNYLATLGVFAQDSWTIKRRLTMNLGLRYESVVGSIPAQKSSAGTFVDERSFAAISNVPNLKGITPRVAFSYDLTGTGRTAVKSSYSRYFLQIGAGLIQNVNPLIFDNVIRSWNDVNADNLPQESELGLPSRPFRDLNQRLDSRLARPYSDEITIGIQHEVAPDFFLEGTYFRRWNRRLLGIANVAVPTSKYIPITIKIENPGGIVPHSLTVYNQDPSTRGQVDFLISNSPILNSNYSGVELDFIKRFSSKWQLLGGFTAGKHQGTFYNFGEDLNNPNLLINRQNAAIGDDATYQFKIAGGYTLPGGISVFGNYLYSIGYPLRRQIRISGIGLTQVNQSIDLASRGQVRLENISLLDLRFSHSFRVSEKLSIEPTIDLFNITNSSSITSSLDTFGFAPGPDHTGTVVTSTVGLPTEVIGPRLLRLGLKFNF